MNRQKTYRFFTLLLAYLAITSTLLANGRVFEAFKSKAYVKKQVAKQAHLPQKQKADHQDTTHEEQQEQERKGKNTPQDSPDEVVVQELTLEHTVPPLNVNLDPALHLLFNIECPSIEYHSYYATPSIALLPYFENVFNHFIVINAP